MGATEDTAERGSDAAEEFQRDGALCSLQLGKGSIDLLDLWLASGSATTKSPRLRASQHIVIGENFLFPNPVRLPPQEATPRQSHPHARRGHGADRADPEKRQRAGRQSSTYSALFCCNSSRRPAEEGLKKGQERGHWNPCGRTDGQRGDSGRA